MNSLNNNNNNTTDENNSKEQKKDENEYEHNSNYSYNEIRMYVLGDIFVGKQSFINKILSLPCSKLIAPKIQKENNNNNQNNNINNNYNNNNQNNNNNKNNNNNIDKIHSLNNPTLLFNIHNHKITIKPFYIEVAETLPDNFEVKEEDSDYELESEINISFEKIKKILVEKITNENLLIKLNEKYNNILINHLFIFLFDLSNYYSLEKIILYYNSISRFLKFDKNIETFNSILIGNKIDKKMVFDNEEKLIFNKFLQNSNLKYYEISCKNFFDFRNFFVKFFIDLYSNKILFNNEILKNCFVNLIKNKSFFSQAKRDLNFVQKNFDVPFYNINDNYLYKNKIGPKIMKSEEKLTIKIKKDKFIFKKKLLTKEFEDKLNGKIKGFSFGLKKSSNSVNNSLIKERENLINIKNDEIRKSLNENNLSKLLNNNNNEKIKNEEYFNNVIQRKKNILNEFKIKRENKINIFKEQYEKNLNKIKKINENKIFLSNSCSNIFNNNKEEEKIKRIERIYNINFKNNKKHLEKKINFHIQNLISPAPNSYDIRGNLLNISKGKTILGKRKEETLNKIDVPFVYIKSDIEKMIENNEKNFKEIKTFEERFKNNNNEFNTNCDVISNTIKFIEEENKKKNKRYQNILENSEKNKNLRNFLSERNIFKKNVLMKKILNEKKEKILFDKNNSSNEINYSLIFENSPSYSLTGRPKEINNKENKIILNDEDNFNENNYNKNNEIFPLPNFNYLKPKEPSFSFGLAKRFNDVENINNFYINNNNCIFNSVFKDGKFSQDTKKFFFKKEMYDNKIKKEFVNKIEDFPGPGQYKIKSSFDEILKKNKNKI